MKKEITIYIDSDGVTTDLIGGACKACDITREEAEAKFDDNSMWAKIENKGPQFWADLKLFNYAKGLVAECQKYGEVVILTSPGNTDRYPKNASQAAAGKVLFFSKHFPGVELIITKHKHRCANENSILVDDMQHNLTEFKKSGGKIFLWPRQGTDNTPQFDETLEKLKVELIAMST